MCRARVRVRSRRVVPVGAVDGMLAGLQAPMILLAMVHVEGTWYAGLPGPCFASLRADMELEILFRGLKLRTWRFHPSLIRKSSKQMSI